MSDLLDEAQANEERERQASIGRVLALAPDGEAADHCIDCGASIPEARRRAVPGVKRCVDCQEDFEGMVA